MRPACFVLSQVVIAVLFCAACREEVGATGEVAAVPFRGWSSEIVMPTRSVSDAGSEGEVVTPGAWVAIHGLPRSPEVVLRAHDVASTLDLFAYIFADTPAAEFETLPVRWLVSDSAVGLDVRGNAERSNHVTLRGMEDALDTGGREPQAVVYACVDGRRQARSVTGPPVACSPPVHVAVVPDLAGAWQLTIDDGVPTQVTITQEGRQVCGFLEDRCGTITGTTLDVNDGFDRWQGHLGSDRRTITGQLLSEDDTPYGTWRAERIDR